MTRAQACAVVSPDSRESGSNVEREFVVPLSNLPPSVWKGLLTVPVFSATCYDMLFKSAVSAKDTGVGAVLLPLMRLST